MRIIQSILKKQNILHFSALHANVQNYNKQWIQFARHIQKSSKQTHPSADRNSKPISEAFLAQIDHSIPKLQLLEISSGSGQHAGYLAPLCPNIEFQPTEYDKSLFSSICAYAKDCKSQNIRQPLYVDISQNYIDWPEVNNIKPASFDYMFNSNMMHISPWPCSVGLFKAAGILLKPKGKMFTYGPYAMDGVLSPESNVNFDASLKQRNPDWGVRDIADLKKLAEQNGLTLEKITEMPSNNKFLTWAKN